MSNPAVNRDANGRFANGNPGGPGRKPREIEIEYLAKMESIVSGETWKAICKRAADDAVAGDSKARAWLSAYLLGQPIARLSTEEPESGLDWILRKLNERPDPENRPFAVEKQG